VHKLARTADGAPVVAGPWQGDEVGELLYWVPFLRWTQTATLGLRDRLHVLRAEERAAWYSGIGAAQAETVDGLGLGDGEPLRLDAQAVQEARSELAGQDPHRRIQRRLLEFAPLDPPPLPAGLDLPSGFVAVRGGIKPPDLPVVRLERFDPGTAQAVIARAEAYVGPYGVEPYLAVLFGVPAVAVRSGPVDGNELRLAATFLAEPPFGPLELLEADTAPDEVARRVTGYLSAAPRSLAPTS
jgi:hypothetical protein